jgi:hypothetical protein
MSFGSSTRRLILRKAFSLLCLAELLFLTVFAAAPGLHQLLHHDAGQADHHCAIIVLAAGKVDLASTPPVVSRPSGYVVLTVQSRTPIFLAVDYQLLPGRAPPSFFA